MTGARFTAVALLGGALASCAPAPKPAPRRAEPPPPSSDYLEPSGEPACGGVIEDDRPTPEQRRRDLVSFMGADAIRCGVRADAEGRHGEVRVTLHTSDAGLSTEAKSSAGLTEEDRQCVEAAAHSAFKAGGVGPGGLTEPLTVYVALGKAPPSLPDRQKLVADWQAALRSEPARKRFAAQLPEDITLDDHGCLSMPARPILVDGIERWLARLEMPLDEFWQPRSWPTGTLQDGLFAGLGPHAGVGARAYLIDDRTVLLYHRSVKNSDDQALCLLPFDEMLRQRVQERVHRQGTCWVGDLRETLLRPRTGVPAGRRFKIVAADGASVCAIDERGERVCCGERRPNPPAATEYSTISGNAARTCRIGKDASVSCDREWPVAQKPAQRDLKDAVIQVWSMF